MLVGWMFYRLILPFYLQNLTSSCKVINQFPLWQKNGRKTKVSGTAVVPTSSHILVEIFRFNNTSQQTINRIVPLTNSLISVIFDLNDILPSIVLTHNMFNIHGLIRAKKYLCWFSKHYLPSKKALLFFKLSSESERSNRSRKALYLQF